MPQKNTEKNPKRNSEKKISDFQRRVLKAVSDVPSGFVTTYKQLANSIGCKSAQAIGQALTKNPFAPKIPCHRVVSSDGRIGGYAFGVQKKIGLLRKEGIVMNKIKEEYRIDLNKFMWSESD